MPVPNRLARSMIVLVVRDGASGDFTGESRRSSARQSSVTTMQDLIDLCLARSIYFDDEALRCFGTNLIWRYPVVEFVPGR